MFENEVCNFIDPIGGGKITFCKHCVDARSSLGLHRTPKLCVYASIDYNNIEGEIHRKVLLEGNNKQNINDGGSNENS